MVTNLNNDEYTCQPQINLLVQPLCHCALRSLGEPGVSVHTLLHSQESGGR